MIFGTVETTLLLSLATLFLGYCAYLGYNRTGDPLHPAVILAPLFFLGMVLEPAQRLLHPELVNFFPEYRGLAFAMAVQYVGLVFFFLGALSIAPRVKTQGGASSLIDISSDARKREKIRLVAWSLALFSLFGYWYGIYMNGGFLKSYSISKGGGLSTVTGYLGEAQNLGVAAVVFYAISLQRSRLTVTSVIAALLMISPTVLQATFGGRRGPMFIAGATLFVSYFIAIGRVPKLRQIAMMLVILLSAMVFVGSQRGNLYFGSGKGLNLESFWESLAGSKIATADNFVVSSGAVLAIYELDEFHWGRRFITTFGIRPIPRVIWPTKYDDVSRFMYGKSFSEIQNSHYAWVNVLGWRPTNGYAINAIVDLYWEFGWLYVLALWLFGRGISMVWHRFRTLGGYWFVGYFLIAALAIYLPTQSFSAFAHRFLYLSVMSFVFWRLTFGGTRKNQPLRRPMTQRTRSPVPRPLDAHPIE
ncbi:MAG: O-antigen polymerase [Planctomycetota bacterium]|jgi:oligosaccharide repeat unit polymerase